MAKLTIQQTANYAQAAGFSGDSLITIVAIAMAESGLDTHAINRSDPYGGSFGILQINGAHFGHAFGKNGMYTMSQAAAFDPALAFIYGHELSLNGTNFRPWGTYTNGSYLKFMQTVRQTLGAPGGSTNSNPFPPYTGQPWYTFNVYTDKGCWPGFGCSTYWNTDVGTPIDTPITASLAGTITDLGYFDWGGQVTWKVDTPSAINGYKDAFVIHLDAINPQLKVGQHINVGDFLGYSGGENSTAGLKPLPQGMSHHITLPSHSSGPHTDLGATNDPFGSLVDSSAKDKAASDMLVSLAKSGHIPFGTDSSGGTSGGGTSSGGSSSGGANPLFTIENQSQLGFIQGDQTLGQAIHNTLVQYPGFYGICDALDEAETFPGFINRVQPGEGITQIGDIAGQTVQSVVDTMVWNTIPLVVRGALILVGMFLILALLWQLAKPNLEALPELVKLGMVVGGA